MVKIKNRYSSLTRELDLEGGTEQFELRPDVQPVVVLHEHCEGDALSSVVTQAGAGGPLEIARVTPSHAGAYQVFLYADWNIAVAAQEALSFRLLEITSGVSSIYLWYFNIGRPAGGGRDSILLPKIHIPENYAVVGNLVTTILAADDVTMGILLQPV